MGLTPLDVENTRFRGALGGYSRGEVEQFMQRVASALEEKLEEIQRLQQQVNSLGKEVEQNREVEDLLKNSVILAQRTCDELISSAHKKADLIRQEAQAEGQQIKWRFAELKSDREQFEYAFHGLLAGFLHRLEQGNPALAKPDAPASPAALAGQQPAEQATVGQASSTELLAGQENLPVGPVPKPLAVGEPPVSQEQPPPSILTSQPPPSPKLPFGQQPGLPQVKLTQAQGQGLDRDADISDFENAVSEAQAEPGLGWEVGASLETDLVRKGSYQEPNAVEPGSIIDNPEDDPPEISPVE